MICVVIDTNVLISGTFWSSASFHVLKLIDEGRIVLSVSREILEEYDELLHRDEILSKSAYSKERAQTAAKLLTKAIIVEPSIIIQAVKDDPDDNKFIEAAVEGNAAYIISQDNHLLTLKEFHSIKILTPEEFLALFAQSRKQ